MVEILVSLEKCESYEYSKVKSAVEKSFENLGGIEKFIKIIKKIEFVSSDEKNRFFAISGSKNMLLLSRTSGKMLHLKQFSSADESGKITTLENGIVDFEKCIKTAKLMGCEHFIVEQDEIKDSELADAKANIDYLKSLKI